MGMWACFRHLRMHCHDLTFKQLPSRHTMYGTEQAPGSSRQVWKCALPLSRSFHLAFYEMVGKGSRANPCYQTMSEWILNLLAVQHTLPKPILHNKPPGCNADNKAPSDNAIQTSHYQSRRSTSELMSESSLTNELPH